MRKNAKQGFAIRPLPFLIAGAMAGMVPMAYAADGTVLEEVVVTAQKRKENLQKVPISVQSMDAKALEKSGVVSIADIKFAVPGLTIASYPGSNETLYPSIRGIVPNSVQVGVPNPLAVHLDGVPLSQTAGLSIAGADLERIEVLKGPQGVLSGRNATGGSINIITAKPELGEFGLKQLVTIAQRGQYLSRTVVNVPMSDTLAAKISYLSSGKDNDGVTNSAPGGFKFGERKSDAYRLDMRWKPTNTVMVDYGYDHATTKSRDTPSQCLYPGNGIVYQDPTGATLAYLATVDPRIKGWVNGCSTNKLSQLYYPFQMPQDKNMAEGHTLTINWEFSPKLSLRSITGYRKVDTSNNVLYTAYDSSMLSMRSDSGPLTILPIGSTPYNGQSIPWTLENESFSQEFQLLGNLGENIKYTTGVFYSSDKGHNNQGPSVAMYIPDAGFPMGATDLVLTENMGISSAKNTSVAFFGQVSWTPDILERKLEIVPGLRYTRDHRRAVGYNNRFAMYAVNPTASPDVVTGVVSIPNASAFTGAVGDRTSSKATPALSLNYHWTERLMTYAKYSKGYTAGGFDTQQGTAAGFIKGFDPETIDSYELGMKGEFMDRRLRANAALFQSKYKNEQKTVAVNNVWAIQNVGSSTYDGIELDLTAAVTPSFRVGVNASWLDHKYDKWMDLDPASPTFGRNIADQRKLVVPRSAYSVNLDYRFPDMGLPGQLEGNLNFVHRSTQSQPLNLTTPNVALYSSAPAFSFVSGRLALTRINAGPGNHGDMTVALWGRNLTDKKYTTFVTPNTSADSAGTWGEPRTVGIDVIYNY